MDFFRSSILLPVLVLAALLLTSCARADLTILADQYWAVTDMNEEQRGVLAQSAEDQNVRTVFREVAYPSDPAVLRQAIEDAGADTVLLSPLFSGLAHDFAVFFPEKRFFIFGNGRKTAIPNAIVIRFNRKAAYLRAGAVCRRFLNEPGNADKKVAAFFYVGGAEREAERSSFLDGIGGDIAERLIVRSFPSIDAAGEVNEALGSLDDHNIGLFFVSMSGLSKELVASISSRFSSPVVTERVGGGLETAYGERIVATIEEEWRPALFSALRSQSVDVEVDAVLVPAPSAESRPWLSDL